MQERMDQSIAWLDRSDIAVLKQLRRPKLQVAEYEFLREALGRRKAIPRVNARAAQDAERAGETVLVDRGRHIDPDEKFDEEARAVVDRNRWLRDKPAALFGEKARTEKPARDVGRRDRFDETGPGQAARGDLGKR